MSQVSQHFDNIAGVYDYYKKKNGYYYSHVKKLYRELIPPNQIVLEVGCGTGDILEHIRPRYGIGIDISPEMIKRAQSKYGNIRNIKFIAGNIEQLKVNIPRETFDYIYLSDVIEHLEDPHSTFRAISEISHPNTTVIISAANPLWEPLLLILEKLKLKMPEGPHYRIKKTEIESIMARNGFTITQKGFRVILPTYIPLISNALNTCANQIPVLKNLCLIMFWVHKKNLNH